MANIGIMPSSVTFSDWTHLTDSQKEKLNHAQRIMVTTHYKPSRAKIMIGAWIQVSPNWEGMSALTIAANTIAHHPHGTLKGPV